MRIRSKHDLRCICAGEPIIAQWGLDYYGRPYIWIKRWKQDRILCEVVITSGEARIHCPKCLRWHRVLIRDHAPEWVLEELPETISLPG